MVALHRLLDRPAGATDGLSVLRTAYHCLSYNPILLIPIHDPTLTSSGPTPDPAVVTIIVRFGVGSH